MEPDNRWPLVIISFKKFYTKDEHSRAVSGNELEQIISYEVKGFW